MEIVKVTYAGGLKTEATHLQSGKSIVTDAPVDNRGDGSSFSPTDMVCSALASCCLTIMAIKARDMKISLQGCEIEVHKSMQSNPRRIAEIKLDFRISENWTEKEKQIMEHSAKTCPVFLSLHPETNKILNFIYS